MANINQTEILEILRKFREKTQILCSILFTEEGFLITLEQAGSYDNGDFHESVGAICANIIALATQGIEIIYGDKKVKQISIKADENRNEGFEIILDSISSEILLSIIFSSSINLGFVLFELNKTIKKLKEYFLEQENNEIMSFVKVKH